MNKLKKKKKKEIQGKLFYQLSQNQQILRETLET